MQNKQDAVQLERIENRIYLIRGQKVMLDSDLAVLYGVSTKRLNEQVRRNNSRFPGDFMFELTDAEATTLWSQIATSSFRHGGRRHLPLVFTEHGALMLASVLNSERAIHTSIYVVRAFAHLKRMLASHVDLARKLEELENKYDDQFRIVFDAIRELMTQEESLRRKIGFEPDNPSA